MLSVAFQTALQPPAIMIADTGSMLASAESSPESKDMVMHLRTEEHCCPTVPVTIVKASSTKVKQSRHRSRRTNKNTITRPVTQFFRPEQNWGGKSPGYAWGFASSRPSQSISLRYKRDRMKRGIYMEEQKRTKPHGTTRRRIVRKP